MASWSNVEEIEIKRLRAEVARLTRERDEARAEAKRIYQDGLNAVSRTYQDGLNAVSQARHIRTQEPHRAPRAFPPVRRTRRMYAVRKMTWSIPMTMAMADAADQRAGIGIEICL